MILALKLILTPFFIGMVTLAGRRWGPVVSGLLMGIPLTSGPISLILALQNGQPFAARAAVGVLAGQASVCIFCLVYSLAAQRWPWPLSVIAGASAFLLATAFWNQFTWSLAGAFLLLLASIALISRLIPRRTVPMVTTRPARWDLPARMLIATLFVFLLTTFSNTLGPQLSGLLSPFPVFGLVLAAFTHRQQGADGVARLLRGVVIGSLSFAGFFLMAGLGLAHLPLALTYSLAVTAALAASGLSYFLAK